MNRNNPHGQKNSKNDVALLMCSDLIYNLKKWVWLGMPPRRVAAFFDDRVNDWVDPATPVNSTRPGPGRSFEFLLSWNIEVRTIA